MPAIERRGRGDGFAGLGVVGAAGGNSAHHVDRVRVAGGEHRCGAVFIGGGEASGIQGSHAGGFVGEAEVGGHWVMAWSVVLGRRCPQ